MSSEFYWVAVALTTILSASRMTRLMTWDEFPPTKWLREKYKDLVGDDWGLLLYCGYCASFWITGALVSWGLMAGVYDSTPEGYDNVPFAAWWIVNGVFAASYAAAIVMANDGDDD